MLTLTRRRGERLNIGLSVEITVIDIGGGRVRLGIVAPRRLAVHRGEVVSRMGLANREALAEHHANGTLADCTLSFPDGLVGLPDHRELLLCESTDGTGLHVLVSKSDPCVQLAVAEAERVMPDYPVREAQIAAALEDEAVTVAVVVTLASAGSPATANLRAPVVIGLSSRRGAQVILWREDLPIRAPVELEHEP